MTRKNKDQYRCVLCGLEATGHCICYACNENAKAQQRLEPGSITSQQLWYINNKLGDVISIQEAVKKVNPDCVWNMDDLSCQEAKKVISILMDGMDGDKNDQ